MISVIIPTLNEERYLRDILNDLKWQTLKEKEVIVVDAGSTDNTVKIAKKYGARVLHSKIKNAGVQRNLGAKRAKGRWVLFIDADMHIGFKLLDHMLNCSKGAVAVRPKTTIALRTLGYYLFVAPANTFAYIFPTLSTRGGCLMVRKHVFRKIGGFNPALAVAEDIDLGRRLAKEGKIRILNEYVFESDRRYKKWGYLKTVAQWWLNGVWMFFFNKSWTQFWTPVR